MPNEVDKSLLDRLQALRGSSEPPERSISSTVKYDPIERSKTPTREEALAARLKSLRGADEASPSAPSTATVGTAINEKSQLSEKTRIYENAEINEKSPSLSQASAPIPSIEKVPDEMRYESQDQDESVSQTDDRALEELLGDVPEEERFSAQPEPSEDQVKALLERLSQSVPRDEAEPRKADEGNEGGNDSDDSDGEVMNREVDDVISRFRDELELEERDRKEQPKESDDEEGEDPDSNDDEDTGPPPDLAFPSVPDHGQDASTTHKATPELDDIAARMAALRSPSSTCPSLSLPSVPTSKPSGKPVKRLTSRTNYTDDDVDSWCIVCLEDATLRCLGCDGDPYCVRCWREMHVGPAAGFDERSHRAVHFTKDKKKGKEKKVALGA